MKPYSTVFIYPRTWGLGVHIILAEGGLWGVAFRIGPWALVLGIATKEIAR